MTVGTAITICISAVGLCVSLVTAAFKVAGAINANSTTNAELVVSTKDLKETFDEFKNNSRQTHKEIFHELGEHGKAIVNHEGRIQSLEKERRT